MYLGHIVEICSPTDIYTNPLLLIPKLYFPAVPVPDPVVEETRERIILTESTQPAQSASRLHVPPALFMATPECSKHTGLRDVGGRT